MQSTERPVVTLEEVKTKVCKKCLTELPITEFTYIATRGDKNYYYSTCKVCTRERYREYNRKRREKAKSKIVIDPVNSF